MKFTHHAVNRLETPSKESVFYNESTPNDLHNERLNVSTWQVLTTFELSCLSRILSTSFIMINVSHTYKKIPDSALPKIKTFLFLESSKHASLLINASFVNVMSTETTTVSTHISFQGSKSHILQIIHA